MQYFTYNYPDTFTVHILNLHKVSVLLSIK